MCKLLSVASLDFLYQCCLPRHSVLSKLAKSAANATQHTYAALWTTRVYASNYVFLFSASTILLVVIAVVSWTLWGWWELGWDVTLSPLEIAKALGVPIFQHSNPPSDAKGLVDRIGAMKIRYGEVNLSEQDGTHAMLLFGEVGTPHKSATPRKQDHHS